jgi:threonine aldolase
MTVIRQSWPEAAVPPFRIELRSDTQTTPTEEMREAMAQAVVGDDLGGEDPTVRELEEFAAEILGKEASLFVTSGTMGNLVSLLTLTRRGDTLLVDPESHVTLAEAGGFATLAGCSVIPIQTPGWLTPDDIEPHIGPVTTHSLNPAIIWTENTHNRRGGVAWGPEVMRELANLSTRNNLRLHIDGARIFNAAAALDVPVADLAEGANTVQFCLSKGLGAPFGSMIVGSSEVITRARRTRQLVGGGMRQAGVMAAAGLIALRDGPGRLADDHRRAKRLGDVIDDLPGLRLVSPVYTNLIFVTWDPDVLDLDVFVEESAKHGVGVGGARGDMFRLVTHHQISDVDIDEAADVLAAAADAAALT